MKVGIVSDIHGNFHALREVDKKLSELKVNEVWCLGDVVGYGAFPNECVEWVRENCSVAVLGNHELVLLGYADIDVMNDYARQAIEWTKEVINEENLEFLRSLGVQHLTECCQLVHDSPVSPGSMEYILSKRDAFRALLSQEREICFFGHTHIPKIYRLVSSSVDEISVDRFKVGSERCLINPGSVGQPRDGDWRASFGVYETEEKVFQIFRVEYPVKLAAREILRAGLPEFLAARLLVGR